MTNEEIQRTMEFILAGQARFDARMEKDEARIARLDDAFVTLVEIARITDERQDRTDQRVDTFDEKLSALADAQLISEAKLAQAQARFDARMEKDEARIARLEDAFETLVEIARITDERQDRTDKRADGFDDRLGLAMSLTDAKMAELAQRLNELVAVVERYINKGINGTPQV